jgi:GNAT superfamily N-acetyltransferase
VDAIRYEIRRIVEPSKLDELFRASWGSPKPGYARVLERSFTWVTAWQDGDLVGFVNVAWDGGSHFFLLDTTVRPDAQRQGVGSGLVAEAIKACRGRGEWLHVDAPADLMERLYSRAGFQPTTAGLIDLTKPSS